MDLHATYLVSIARMEDEIREYQAQRKKLESRRFVRASWMESVSILNYGQAHIGCRLEQGGEDQEQQKAQRER